MHLLLLGWIIIIRLQKLEKEILASLHWLPVKSRIEFKILLLTYKALNGQAPSYLKEFIVPYYPTRTLRSQHAAYWWLLRSPKVEWEAEPSAIRLLS